MRNFVLTLCLLTLIDTGMPMDIPPLMGEETGTEDDALSKITCPEGLAPLQCDCDDFTNCDSNWISSGNKWSPKIDITSASTCGVVHAARKDVVRPIVRCGVAALGAQAVSTIQYSTAESLSIDCPAGTTVYSCGLWYPWSRRDDSVRAIKNGLTGCKVNKACTKGGNGGAGCRIQAVCVPAPSFDEAPQSMPMEMIPMTGEETGIEDDSPSTVTCPEGTGPIQCDCDNFTNCDSNWISNGKKWISDGNKWSPKIDITSSTTCGVTHAAKKAVVRPVVRCGVAALGAQVVSTVQRSTSESLSIECPAGTTVYSCGLWYPWSHRKGADSVRAIKNGTKGCKVNKACTEGRTTTEAGCRIQAICVPTPSY